MWAEIVWRIYINHFIFPKKNKEIHLICFVYTRICHSRWLFLLWPHFDMNGIKNNLLTKSETKQKT